MHGHATVRRLFLGALRLAVRRMFRLEVDGRQHVPLEGGVIVASNHSTRVMDPLILATVSPRELTIIAHADFRRRPFVYMVTRLQGAIFVAASPWVGVEFVAACEGVLARGDALGIFPEGREMGGGNGDFRHGAAYLGLRNRCRLVPAWVERRGFRRFRVAYGAPLEPSRAPINRRTLEQLTARLQGAINALGSTDAALSCAPTLPSSRRPGP